MKPKNAFSTLLTVLTTAVIVGVLTGVISYSYATSKKDLEIEGLKEQLSQTSSSASSSVTDETKSWKTYTSDVYGFTIQYPDNWELSDTKLLENKLKEGIAIEKIDKGEIEGDHVKISQEDGYIRIYPRGAGRSNIFTGQTKKSKIKIDNLLSDREDEFDDGKVSASIIRLPNIKNENWSEFAFIDLVSCRSNKSCNMTALEQILFTFQFTSDNNSDKSSTNLKSEILMESPEDNDPSTRNSGVSFNIPSDWLRKNEKFYNAGSSVEYYTDDGRMTKMMTAYTQDVPADFGTSKQGITTQKTTVNNYSVYKWTEKDGAVTYSFEAGNGEFAYKFTFDKNIDSKIIDQVVNSVSY